MLLFTEFTSVDGICAGATALLKDFLFDESQRPIIAQIYGRKPENFYQTAIILCQLGFDGIDINMGCPSKGIAHAGAGAGLIRTPHVAQAIVRATQRGVRDWQNGATVHDCVDIPVKLAAQVEARWQKLPPTFQQPRAIPVSVKTRIGYDESQVDEWIPQLLETEPVAISLHGRTLTQGYKGLADWDEIGRAAEIARDTETLVLGNGDLRSLVDAHQRVATYRLDGALIGRAAYGNPFVFRPEQTPAPQEPEVDKHTGKDGELDAASHEERYKMLHIALEHARMYEASFSHIDRYQFIPMRKHFGWYVRDLPGASHLRRTLVQITSLNDAVSTIEQYMNYRQDWKP